MLDPAIRTLLDTAFAAPEPATPDVALLRAAAERAPALFGGDPEALHEVKDALAGHANGPPVPVRIYRPSPTRPLPLVLFAHGGGWVTGSRDSHDKLCRILANGIGAVVCAVDYRRAPECPHPAALDDVDAAWHWCREEARALGADPDRMAVCGDSAGGHLAVSLALRLKARREALPGAQLLLYPALDARTASASYDEYATGHNLSARMMRWYWRAYAQDAPPDDPELCPLAAASFRGLPPAVVAIVPADVLRDDGREYARRLARDGVGVDVVDCTGMVHGFARWIGAVPAARDHLAAFCAAARRLLHAED
jgi:acetyl esterase